MLDYIMAPMDSVESDNDSAVQCNTGTGQCAASVKMKSLCGSQRCAGCVETVCTREAVDGECGTNCRTEKNLM